MLRLMTIALAGLLFALASAVADGPKIGPHGGQIRDAGGKHLELVVSMGELSLYVTDGKHRPVSTQRMKARAIVLSGGKRVIIELAPGGKNVLRGGGEFTKTKKMKTVVLLTLEKGKTIQARFSK